MDGQIHKQTDEWAGGTCHALSDEYTGRKGRYSFQKNWEKGGGQMEKQMGWIKGIILSKQPGELRISACRVLLKCVSCLGPV